MTTVIISGHSQKVTFDKLASGDWFTFNIGHVMCRKLHEVTLSCEGHRSNTFEAFSGVLFWTAPETKVKLLDEVVLNGRLAKD